MKNLIIIIVIIYCIGVLAVLLLQSAKMESIEERFSKPKVSVWNKEYGWDDNIKINESLFEKIEKEVKVFDGYNVYEDQKTGYVRVILNSKPDIYYPRVKITKDKIELLRKDYTKEQMKEIIKVKNIVDSWSEK